jgi:hypothetical protein
VPGVAAGRTGARDRLPARLRGAGKGRQIICALKMSNQAMRIKQSHSSLNNPAQLPNRPISIQQLN